MSFVKRVINLSFQLGEGSLADGGENTVTFEGLRSSVNIVHGGIYGAQADVQIWGMSLDLMNKLTVTQKFFFKQRPNNVLTIMAGDEEGTAVCFTGGILEAWADGKQPPDVVFHVTAMSGLIDLSQPAPPASFSGGVDAALAIEQIAGQSGYSLENNNVHSMLVNPYKPGTPRSQIENICRDIDCEFTIDDGKKVVAIWPKGESRSGDVILVSPATGMIGYPSFSQGGVQVSTIYNPNLEFGRKFRVESQFGPANGEWKVYGLAHRLESNLPGGQWSSDIEATYLGNEA